MTTTSNFSETYTNANSLEVGSTFSYIDNLYTVVRFTSNSIITVDSSNNKRKFTAHEFDGYVYYGFVKNICR